jgi:hypothetical protein
VLRRLFLLTHGLTCRGEHTGARYAPGYQVCDAWGLLFVGPLILGTTFMAEPPVWEVVRSEDGDIAFSMPAQPVAKTHDAYGPAGTLEMVTFSCSFMGSLYFVQRTKSNQSVAPGKVIDELAQRKKDFVTESARLVKETKVVVDGVIGDDFTYTVAASQGDRDVTNKRTRHYLTGRFYYVLTVVSPAGRPLPEDAGRFLSSLTFEAVVKAYHTQMKVPPKPAVKPERGAGRTAAQTSVNAPRAVRRPEGRAPLPERRVKVVDSSPEDALKTFLLALAAQDVATLRAVTLPDDEFDWLLNGRPASTELLERIEARIDKKPMRRLKAGDPVRMPDGETRIIKSVDVGEGRVVLWPDGALLPSRVEVVDGHWKVYARPLIVARKLAAAKAN